MIFIYIKIMRIFERYFHIETSLNQIDKYVRLVLQTFDPDDDIEVTYEDQGRTLENLCSLLQI